MNIIIRDILIAVTISPLLIACVLFPAMAGVGVVVLAAVVVGFVLGRTSSTRAKIAPALPVVHAGPVETVDGTWRDM